MPEGMCAEAWVYGTITSGTVVCDLVGGTVSPRIYTGMIPQGTIYPAVTIAMMTANPEWNVQGKRGLASVLVDVRAIAVGSHAAAGSIFAAFDSVLQDASGTVIPNASSTAVVHGCAMESSYGLDEYRDGRRYAHVGAQYRLWLEV
jgi:hypothetical protein